MNYPILIRKYIKIWKIEPINFFLHTLIKLKKYEYNITPCNNIYDKNV